MMRRFLIPVLFLRKTTLLIFIAFFAMTASTLALAEQQWQVRLAPMPVSFGTRTTITGLGQATATLNADILLIRGTFSGLHGKATRVKIHQGPKAIPGPHIIDLELTLIGDGKQGELSGAVKLSQQQLTALQQQSLYIQIDSESAKEGNLRGWILPLQN